MDAQEAVSDVYSLLVADSPFCGTVVSVTTLIVVWLIYRLATRVLRRYADARVKKRENPQDSDLVLRCLWPDAMFLFVLSSYSCSLATRGISAAFLGMMRSIQCQC